MTFPILASLLVRLVVLLPFQLLRLSLATPSRWTPLALSDRKSGSAGMPRPISYAVFCLKKKIIAMFDRDPFETFMAVNLNDTSAHLTTTTINNADGVSASQVC